MTTNNDHADTQYEIARRAALLIEDQAIADEETSDIEVKGSTPQDRVKLYVQATLDNGYISSMDDTPVWELVELLGFDRDNFDPFAAHEAIARAIDETDLFND
jgi:hypothetical protein